MENTQIVLDTENGAAPDDTAPTRVDVIQQRVQELASKAQSYMGRPTNANYKQALSLYERILAFSDINDDQRAEFQRRLADARAAYEQFRAQFGELTTARQLQRDEVELVELRKLINADVETGPDGEELEPQFDKLLVAVREKLLRVARELADQANKQATDGMDYFDAQLLDMAIATYEQAIRRLQGEEIHSGDGSPATGVAIAGIKNLLLNEAAQTAIKKYEQRATGVRDARVTIQRIRPLYDEADAFFRQGAYAHAVATLESVQELVGKQFSSVLVDGLQRRALQRWEQAALAQADALYQTARIAASRADYEQVERVVGELIALEPHLDTEALKQRKSQARELIDDIQNVERRLQELVGEAGLARVRGELADAERLARQALVLRPGHKSAQQVLDSLLTIGVHNAVRAAEDALAAPEQARLQSSRDLLEQQRQFIGEISDQAARRKLLDRVEEAVAHIKRAIEKFNELSEKERQAQTLLEKARNQAAQGRYADALATLAEARALDPLNPQIDAQESEARGTWAEQLRGRAREFMEATPPHPAAALECLNTLRDIGMDDVASTELRRRVDWQANSDRGLAFLNAGNYAEAIEALRQADLHEPTIAAALSTARCRETQRLMNLGRWGAAAEVAQQIVSDDPEVQTLVSRARAEYHMDQAQGFFNLKVFDGAEARLREAEREPLSDLPARVEQLREQIASARAIFRKVQNLQQRAQDQYRRYRSYNNTNDLLEAIRTLDEALELDDLPTEDRQRETIRKLRAEYQQRYHEVIVAERTRLLADGDRALQEERFERLAEAIQHYKAVLELSPNREDAEALGRIEHARQLIDQTRNRLIDEASLLLNMRGARTSQRGVRVGDVQALIARFEKALHVDPEPHRGLSEALLALQSALRSCEAADSDLRTARAHWAAARRNGDVEFREVDLDLQRAVRYFEDTTYTHYELDRNNPASLVRQLQADREVYRTIARAGAAVAKALEGDDDEAIVSSYAELARAEEAALAAAAALGDQGGLAVPASTAERYPHQYKTLQALADKIQERVRQEQEAPDVQELRVLMQRRAALQRLMERLDRDNRFGLR